MALLASGVGISHVIRPAGAVQPTVHLGELEANGWVKVDPTAESVIADEVRPVDVEAVAATVRYDNERLQQENLASEVDLEYRGQTTRGALGEYYGSEFDQPMGTFAATKSV